MTFRTGDIVEITSNPDSYAWKGFRCEVLPAWDNDLSIYTRLLPLSDRPDGFKRIQFLWTTKNLRKV
jgi:hypothetical protein